MCSLTIPAGAATLAVTTTSDSGAGSLRQALANAASGDVIYFAPSLDGTTITLSSNISLTGKSVTIDAMALTNGIVLEGSNSRDINFDGERQTLWLRGVTFNALRLNGGQGTEVIIDYCTLRNNTRNLGYGWGGAMYSAGNVTIRQSTFHDNRPTQSQGGALAFGGEGTVNIVNTTFYNNRAEGGFGGAIYIESYRKLMYVRNSTFANNSLGGVGTGGTIRLAGGAKGFFRNNIFWGNSDAVSGIETDNLSVVLDSVAISEGYNIILAGTGLNLTGTDITTNPWLAAAALNGGRTLTMVPADNGSADTFRIPAGTNQCGVTPDIDQRGMVRGAGTAGSCTIGAVELDASGAAAASTRKPRTLAVLLSSGELGTVASSPAGIDCGSTCATTASERTTMTLTATPSTSYHTGRWTGCDYNPGPNVCVVTPTFGDADVSTSFSGAALLYSNLSFDEAQANNGSVSGSSTITLYGDTFAGNNGDNLVALGRVIASNVPAGLTAVVTRNSATQATLTFSGAASAHTAAATVPNVTLRFQNAAFAGANAAEITGATRSDVTVRFSDANISWAPLIFSEASSNNGAVLETAKITLFGAQFAASLAGAYTATNVPPGLTLVVERDSATQATIYFTGNATNHATANTVNDVRVSLLNAAFVGSTAAAIQQSTSPNMTVRFSTSVPTALRSITYSAVNFAEAPANNGTIIATAQLSLYGDQYSGTAGEDFVASGKVLVTNVPPGLTVAVRRTTINLATLSFAGAATGHAAANSVNNLNVIFLDNAFVGNDASQVTNSIRNNLAITFLDPPFFTVTASAGAGGSISPTTTNVTPGGTASFTLTPATGYHIAGVTGCGGTLSGSTYTTGAVNAACAVSATFAINTYTVTAEAGTGGSIDPGSASVEHGATASFTVAPAAGYSLVGVSGCGGTLVGTTFTTGAVTGACTVSASFSLNSYPVSASAGVGGSISPTSATVSHGATTDFLVTPDTGYSIGSVTGCDGALTDNSYTTGAIGGACAVTATFTLNSYAVTATAAFGGSISPADATVDQGATTSFTVTPATGYSIDTVTGCDGTLTGNTYTTAAITGACAVNATFSLNDYLVSATASPGGAITPASTTVEHGSDTTFTLTPDTGYSLDEVTGCDGTLTGNTYTTGAIVGACTVSATFSLNHYTVSTSAGPGGSVSPAHTVVPHGTSATFTLTPDPGFNIVAVSGCDGTLSGNTYTTAPATGACTVAVAFTLNTYFVDAVVAAGQGTITPDNVAVSHGSPVSLTLTPDVGYSIQEATGCDGTLIEDVYTIDAVLGSCTVSAKYSLNHYPVTATAEGGGSISPASLTADHGSTPVFTVTPDAGYYISVVEGCDGTLRDDTYTTAPISGACDITAKFTRILHSVTASAGEGGAISPVDASVPEGASRTFTVLPHVGYGIASVTGCDGTLEGTRYRTGPVMAACAVTASFTRNVYTVSASVVGTGTVTPTQTQVTHGQQVTFELSPAIGFAVQSATGCSGTLEGNTFVSDAITAACMLDVTFVPQGDVVVISRGGGGAFEWLSLGALLLFAIRRHARGFASAALLVCLVSTQARAEQGWYAGAQGGRASTDVGSADVNAALAAYDITGIATVRDSTRTAWRLFGGYRINRWFAVEGGYVDLGNVTTRITGLGTTNFYDVRDLLPSSGNGVELHAVASYTFASRVRLMIRGGAWRWGSEYKVVAVDGTATTYDVDGVDTVYGAGLEVNINSKWRMRASWDRYTTNDDEASVVMLGLVRKL